MNIEQLFRRKTASLSYIPEVDGIRFVAITMVFLLHAFYTFHSLTSPGPTFVKVGHVLFDNGAKGVLLFFILSGFILSLPFAKYYLQQGKRIDLKAYYLRRLIRLEPPYIIAMSLFALLQIAKTPEFAESILTHLMVSFAYLHNIVYQHWSYINLVAWTLEVEVQFYLLAPLICRVFLLSMKMRRLLLWSAVVVLTMLQFIYLPVVSSLYQYLHFFLLGILLTDYHVNGYPRIFLNGYSLLVSLGLFMILYFLPSYAHRPATFLFPFAAFCWMMSVFANERVKKMLSGKVISLIGGMCYSIYLLHFPLCSITGEWLYRIGFRSSSAGNFILHMMVYVIVVLLVSSLFYLLIEKPFMVLSTKWKGRQRTSFDKQ